VLYSNNQGAHKLPCNSVFHNWTKYTDICHHVILDTIENGHASLYIFRISAFKRGLIGPKHKASYTVIRLRESGGNNVISH
jgi:hypothetical protein